MKRSTITTGALAVATLAILAAPMPAFADTTEEVSSSPDTQVSPTTSTGASTTAPSPSGTAPSVGEVRSDEKSQPTEPTEPSSTESPVDPGTVESGDGTSSPADGDATGVLTPVTPTITPEPVEGWWAMPDGGTPDHVTWSQPVANPAALTCGTWHQVDLYPSQEALDALAADGVLEQGEDYGIVISWRFVYGGDCPVVPDIPTGGDTTPDEPTPNEPETGIDVPVVVEVPAAPAVPVVTVAAPAPAHLVQREVLAATGPGSAWLIPVGGGALLAGALLVAARIRRSRDA